MVIIVKYLYNKSIEKSCAYCRHGRLSADKTDILCLKKGVMLKTSSCRHYKYDALKREPKARVKIAKHTAEEFSLN